MDNLERVSLRNELNLAWSKADSICEHIEWLYENGYIESLDECLSPYNQLKYKIEQEAIENGISLKF